MQILAIKNYKSMSSRLCPVNFNIQKISEQEAPDDENDGENIDDEIKDEDISDDGTFLRRRPLAISEIDETMAEFDISTISGIISSIQPQGISKFQVALKVLLTHSDSISRKSLVHVRCRNTQGYNGRLFDRGFEEN
jgi:hypothetical protein